MKPRKRGKYNPKLNYKVVHKDRDIIVVDKPPGLLTVPIPKIKSLNLEDLLNKKFDPANHEIQAAHRIDRYTGGLVVFALTHRSHKNLVEQFRAHTPDRAYLSLVRGTPDPLEGELVHHMKLIKEGFRNVIVPENDPKGTRARLKYVTITPGEEISLLKIFLDTGLKNQIRVQFSEIGCPLVGDRHYDQNEKKRGEFDRQALHAAELAFDHPRTGKRVSYTSDLPKDMKELMERYNIR